MSWEKLGIRFVAKLSSSGGGLKVRIPKDMVEAYDLYNADKGELTLERVLRQPKTMTNGGRHIISTVGVLARKASRKKGSSEALSRGENVSRPDIRTRRHGPKGSQGA